jgi:hypothetical protein
MKIDVQVSEVTLDSKLGDRPMSDGDDGYHTEPFTLGDAVIQEVARQLIAAYGRSYDMQRVVTEIRGDLIREHLGPVVQAAIDAPAQRTNRFGEVQGGPVSMRELLVDEARKVLNARVDSSGRPAAYASDGKNSYLEHVITRAVRDVFDGEMKAELDRARAELRETLRQVAAAKLAESVKV